MFFSKVTADQRLGQETMLFCIMARKVPNICSRDFCVFENGKQFFKVTSERFRNFNVALDETKQRSFLYSLKDVSFGDG